MTSTGACIIQTQVKVFKGSLFPYLTKTGYAEAIKEEKHEKRKIKRARLSTKR